VTQQLESAKTALAVTMRQGRAPLRLGQGLALTTKQSSLRLRPEHALVQADLPPVPARQFSTAEPLSP
jgi:hypothetical protein